MADFFSEYGLFLAKTLTAVFAILFVMAVAFGNAAKLKKTQEKGSLRVRRLNEELKEFRDSLQHAFLSEEHLKKRLKAQRKEDKRKRKKGEEAADGKRIFVVDFDGDMKASQVDELRQVITAILGVARAGQDEVLLRLESPGGMVHGYGLAASQLRRLREAEIRLTIAVDKVAASGGYMMACIADHLVAAPFAYIGSVGVVMQLPNVHRLLQEHQIDYEMITAGEHKRTLTVFGENTEKGRQKAHEDIQEAHELFKAFIRDHRPTLDVDGISTGETWFGTRALEKGLVDAIATSDELIVEACEAGRVYHVSYEQKMPLGKKLGHLVQEGVGRGMDHGLLNWAQRSEQERYFS